MQNINHKCLAGHCFFRKMNNKNAEHLHWWHWPLVGTAVIGFLRENSVEKPISFSGPSVLTLVGVLSSWVRVNHILQGFIILGSI